MLRSLVGSEMCIRDRYTCKPSFILIRPTIWPQYSNVTDRTGQTGQRSDGIGRTVFGRPFVKRFALCHRSVVCLSVLTCVSVTFVHCGQTVGRIKTKLGKQVGLIPGHMVLDGDPAPLPKKGAEPLSPIFDPCPLWPNGWMDQDGIWHGDGPWSRPRARWGPSSPR